MDDFFFFKIFDIDLIPLFMCVCVAAQGQT